jgi:pilus assembly protein TadC
MPWALLAALASGLAVLAWRSDPGGRLKGDGGGVSIPARRLAPGSWGARLGGAIASTVAALVLTVGLGWWGVAAAAAVGVVSYVVLGRLRTGEAARREARLIVQLPQACDLLAVCLEAGLPLRRAATVISEALDGPLAEVLGEVAAKVRLGAGESESWDELGRAEPALATLGREVARALGSGVALARTLRALGVEARLAAASAAEVRARRVGVRSVLPLMLCFLPAFLLLGVVPIIGGVAQHLLP